MKIESCRSISKKACRDPRFVVMRPQREAGPHALPLYVTGISRSGAR